jgi:hypothetical protein
MPGRFSRAQIDQISRTVKHTPEVMVKVTGGRTRRGAVAAHFAYICRQGAEEIETDDGERIGRLEEHKRLLDDWHLELTTGQYRREKDGPARRPTKLVHSIVLSMPAPTPPDKVLAAARQFARQKFAQHRYAMVLHTHQQHPREVILAGDVRYFAHHLPPVLTDRQRLAAQFIELTEKQRRIQRDGPERGYPQDQERTL